MALIYYSIYYKSDNRITAIILFKSKCYHRPRRRSNRPEVLCKKMFLKISKNSQENTCAWVSFLIKLQSWGLQLYWKETPAQVFPCEFCEIFKTTFFYRTPPMAAFLMIFSLLWDFQKILWELSGPLLTHFMLHASFYTPENIRKTEVL